MAADDCSNGLPRPVQDYSLRGKALKVQTDSAMGVAGVLWPAQERCAEVVAQTLMELTAQPAARSEGIDFLELGAGCGAMACAFASEPSLKRVIASDLPSVLPLMSQTAQLNDAAVECKALPFGDIQALELLKLGPVRLIVACEVVYWGGWDMLAQDTVEPLVKTLSCALDAPLAVAVLAAEIRDGHREFWFLGKLEERGIRCWRKLPDAFSPGVGELGIWLLQKSSFKY
mmetsp:Transcript_37554/g.70006  ORF Transcript_37554/g.70006 Transcript_37554/m.70006 type:complete len:230 (-) Transcript_37554:41-730(-)